MWWYLVVFIKSIIIIIIIIIINDNYDLMEEETLGGKWKVVISGCICVCICVYVWVEIVENLRGREEWVLDRFVSNFELTQASNQGCWEALGGL